MARSSPTARTTSGSSQGRPTFRTAGSQVSVPSVGPWGGPHAAASVTAASARRRGMGFEVVMASVT